MRYFSKLILRFGLPVLAVLVLAAALLYLFFPGHPSGSLSQTSGNAGVSKVQGLGDSPSALNSAVGGAAGLSSPTRRPNTGINLAPTNGQSDPAAPPANLQSPVSPISQPTPIKPPPPTPLPVNPPQPISPPCNNCVPGAGHMCPMAGDAQTIAPQYVCACGYSGGTSNDFIVCRLR